MKTILSLLLITFALNAPLFALIKLGEGQVNLNFQVSSYYDSEIRSRNESQEDFIIYARPSLTYYRPSKNLDLSASIGLINQTYVDFDEYNDTDIFFDLNISPNAEGQTSRFKFSGDLLLNSETRTDDDVGEIVTIQNYGASGQLVYKPNKYYNITGDISYRQRDPDSDSQLYTTLDQVEGALSVSIPRSDDISWSGGIRYRDSTSDSGGVNGTILTYFVGLSGNLMPKLLGSLSVGVQEASYDLLDDNTSPYMSSDITWRIDELSHLSLTTQKGIRSTIDDRSSEYLSIRLSAGRNFSRVLNGSVYAGYERDQYESPNPELIRDDKEFRVGASLNYDINRWSSIGFTVDYSDQSSTNGFWEYNRLRVGSNFSAKW